MSWTPTFLIKKEEIEKQIIKVNDKINIYTEWEEETNNEVESIISQEIEKLKKSNQSLGNPISLDKLKELAEENVKNKTTKIWNEFHEDKEKKNGYLYKKLYDIKGEIGTDVKVIEGVEYIYEYVEFTSEAEALRSFLDKNKITYITIGG